MTKHFQNLDDLELVELIKSGAVGVIPTDTVYGLVALAHLPDSLDKINLLKQRHGKPGTIIAASVEQLIELGLDQTELNQVATFWPNPVSIIISSSAKTSYLDLGLGTLAARIPNDTNLLNLLENTGPLVSSSANLADQPVCTIIKQAVALFGDNLGFYVDGGNLSSRQASAIAKLTEGHLEVIRTGAFKII